MRGGGNLRLQLNARPRIRGLDRRRSLIRASYPIPGRIRCILWFEVAEAITNATRGVGSAIVVIGVSAGGMDALTRLVAQIPKNFPAPVFIVQHMSADATGDALVDALNRHGELVCSHPRDGEHFERGHIYLAPSDHHMMIAKGRILIKKGAAENRSRPAIAPLFRSAAVTYGNKVIG